MRYPHLILLAFIGTLATAQTPRRPTTLSIGGTVGTPLGQFNEEYGKAILGLGGNISVPMMGILPLETGFAFNWGRLGAERETVVVDQAYLSTNEGELRTTSNMYSFHLQGRFRPFTGRVSPYVDGLAGVRTFSTRTRITVEGLEEDLSNERNALDATWSYGWAAGIQVKVGAPLYVEARVEKLQGHKVDYVDPETIIVTPSGQVEYQLRSSHTDVFNVHLGIGFTF